MIIILSDSTTDCLQGIYWPDGSPGQPSINDWQESYPTVKLQNGRWYPTAMIMSNGSILVVGGQDGSNGKAVPTMELLPPVGPNLTLPFLQRTDPYNLYPFTAVLPSGGIFIAYYNEALIMDEVTFATTKTLSNMPGGESTPNSILLSES
jgi:Glyoxal oxidase N-terminus